MTTTPEHAGAVERLTRITCSFAQHNDRDGIGWSSMRHDDVCAVLGELERLTRALSRADARVLELENPTDEALERAARAREPELWDRSFSHDEEFEDAEAWRAFQMDALRKALAALNATSPGMGSGDEKAAVVSDSGRGTTASPSPTSEGL